MISLWVLFLTDFVLYLKTILSKYYGGLVHDTQGKKICHGRFVLSHENYLVPYLSYGINNKKMIELLIS
jgi:hypothetical protein